MLLHNMQFHQMLKQRRNKLTESGKNAHENRAKKAVEKRWREDLLEPISFAHRFPSLDVDVGENATSKKYDRIQIVSRANGINLIKKKPTKQLVHIWKETHI